MRTGSPRQLELQVVRSEADGQLAEEPRKTEPPVELPPAARPDLRPAATELLEKPGALLTRSHLRDLGLERRAIDAVFRALPVIALPGYSRPMIRAQDYSDLVARSTFRGDRVRPGRS